MAAKKPSVANQITVSATALKWLAGFIGAVLGALVLWWQVWDRIDGRWRREEIQQVRDAKAEADLKALELKATAALASHSVAEQRARAWLLYSVVDFRASAETRWAEECVDKKRPPDVCREYERKAAESRARAAELRAQANEASKEKLP